MKILKAHFAKSIFVLYLLVNRFIFINNADTRLAGPRLASLKLIILHLWGVYALSMPVL